MPPEHGHANHEPTAEPLWLYQHLRLHDDESPQNREVLRAFRESDEFRALLHGQPKNRVLERAPIWAALMLEIGWALYGLSAEALGSMECYGIVFFDIPAGVVCESDRAGEVLDELRAFWTFADRVLGLRNARSCIEALCEGDEVLGLENRLADQRNYRPAKRVYLECRRAGREPTDEELELAFEQDGFCTKELLELGRASDDARELRQAVRRTGLDKLERARRRKAHKQ